MNRLSPELVRQQGKKYLSNILTKNKIYNAVVSMRNTDNILKDAETATTTNKGRKYWINLFY